MQLKREFPVLTYYVGRAPDTARATTIITFLIVFLIQNTQNRDTRAINLKLDEVIRSHNHAHNEMINIEKLSDEELEQLAKHYDRIREECDHRATRKLIDHAKKNIAV